MNSSIPVAVSGGLSLSAFTPGGDNHTGLDHACGLIGSGAAYCWGSNGEGQLGNGSTTDSSVPVKVAAEP